MLNKRLHVCSVGSALILQFYFFCNIVVFTSMNLSYSRSSRILKDGLGVYFHFIVIISDYILLIHNQASSIYIFCEIMFACNAFLLFWLKSKSPPVMLSQQKPLKSSKKGIQNSYQIYELLIPYKSQSTIVCIPST